MDFEEESGPETKIPHFTPDLHASIYPRTETAPTPPSPEEAEGLNTIAAFSGNLAINQTVVDPETPVDRDQEVFRLKWDPETLEVGIESDKTLADYEAIMHPDDFAEMRRQAEGIKDDVSVYIGATYEGGGVAMMRPDQIHLMRLMIAELEGKGSVHWFVLRGKFNETDPNPYLITKKMHNIAQRRLAPDVHVTDEELERHWAWNEMNYQVLRQQQAIVTADNIFIDDPQPAPQNVMLRRLNPNATYIWRNHIDTDHDLMSDPTTPQSDISRYLLETCGISQVDAIVAHPVPAFMHPGQQEKTYFAPATVSEMDELLIDLSPEEVAEQIAFLNKEVDIKNAQLVTEGRADEVQPHIDVNRKRIVLIARFDLAKGMKKAMKLGAMVREQMRQFGYAEDSKDLPQIIIVGNGATDDPDGVPLVEEKMRIKREEMSEEDKHDVIILRPKHNYKAINALMYPTKPAHETDHAQMVALQMSDAEGCETRITDWILHGVPVVISNRGGMYLQVVEGESGFVLDYDKPGMDLERGAQIITEMMTNPSRYAMLRQSTERTASLFNRRDFSTGLNVIRHMRVMNRAKKGLPADKLWQAKDISSTR